ncbi:MAG: Rab family GTPase [Candidatus Odinarchaeota archaeon]
MSFLEFIKSKRSLKKVLLLGSGAVGKTSLVRVLKEDKSLEEFKDGLEYHRTPFLELETVTASGLLKNDPDLKGTLQLWDVAGQFDLPVHALRDISKSVLGSVDLIILMFSNENVQSLLDLAMWLEVVNEHHKDDLKKDTIFVLISNKTDLSGDIDQGLIDQVMNAEPRIIHFFKISCMTGLGIKELKEWLVEQFFGIT